MNYFKLNSIKEMIIIGFKKNILRLVHFHLIIYQKKNR